MPQELLVLTSCPTRQSRFEALKDSAQRGFIEVTIVVPPSSQNRVVSGRQLSNAGRGLSRQFPTPDRSQHLLLRLRTHPGQEALDDPAVAALGDSGPEGVAQESKLLARMRLAATTVPAIHNRGLLQVEFQPILHQSPLDSTQNVLGLLLGQTMRYRIVRVSGEWTIGVDLLHPSVKGVRHEQVHQHRAD